MWIVMIAGAIGAAVIVIDNLGSVIGLWKAVPLHPGFIALAFGTLGLHWSVEAMK